MSGPADASFGSTILHHLCLPLFLHRLKDKTISRIVEIICSIFSSHDSDQIKSLLAGQCKTEICKEHTNILFKHLWNYQTKVQIADLRTLYHHSEQTVGKRDHFTHNRTWKHSYSLMKLIILETRFLPNTVHCWFNTSAKENETMFNH